MGRFAYSDWIRDIRADPTRDISPVLQPLRRGDLYWCPHCGFKFTERYPRNDLITYCWGPCLELYGEPIPIEFVRGIGRGRPASETPF